MLRERLISAAAGLPLVAVLVIVDGFPELQNLPLLLFVVAVAALCGEELSGMLRAKGWEPPRYSAALLAALPALFMYFLGRPHYSDWMLPLVTLGVVVDVLLVALGLISDAARRLWAAGRDFLVTAAVGLYIGVGLGFLLLLRELGEGSIEPLGFWPVVLVLAVAWGTDTAAFFGGRYFGRHLFWPRLSPKKTWEGFLMGVAASALVMVFFSFTPPGRALGIINGFWVGAVLGMVAHLGDLLESALKRALGAKDSGRILRGHGGVMDAFDSVMLVAPALYLVLVWLAR